ncbi:hypothetical protein [Empedobacter sp.]|uniref:hypothetical protein n=1 Tax=Empedobacter sp. TaxID=1927715 RepID=UPI00289977BE|nr:hypothetical protein [Empedobacter sp.]
MDFKLEERAANIILKRGVKVPVTAPLFLRLFGKKKINLVVKALSIYTLKRVAVHYLQMQIKSTEEMTIPEGFEIIQLHDKAVSKIIAESILNNRWLKFLVPFVAYWLRGGLQATELFSLFQLVIVYGGIHDFINTIRLTEATRITMPMNLSQKETTS